MFAKRSHPGSDVDTSIKVFGREYLHLNRQIAMLSCSVTATQHAIHNTFFFFSKLFKFF